MTYDRGGFSRSTLDEPVEDMRLRIHSDDVHRLLAALTTEPAYVFGSSVGALIRIEAMPTTGYILMRHRAQRTRKV